MAGVEDDIAMIRALVEWSGENPAQIAKRIGAANTTINRFKNGSAQTRLGRSTVLKLREAYPEFPDWPERAVPPIATVDASASDPTVALDSLDLSYSMGPGTELQNYIESEPIRFDPVFLRRLTRAEWSRLKLARGVGDSMQPTLFPGDVVMIDTTQTNLNMQDRIYALAINGAAAIKRIRLERDRRIMIVSDNPDVENYHVEEDELVVHGRVIWFGREL